MKAAELTAATVLGWLEEGRRVAAGLLVEIEGSAPLDAGASLYVDADGTIEGNVTGGCVESAVAQEAMALLATDGAPRMVTYGISDELAGTAGLMCGGIVHLLIHEVSGTAAEVTRLGLESAVGGEPGAVSTVLDGPQAGHRMFVGPSGRTGTLGGSELLDRNVEREARGLIAQGRTTVRSYRADGAPVGTDVRVHIHALVDPPRMVIVGASDYAVALARAGQALGYRVTICDPRRAFMESSRFSAYADAVARWPAEVIEELAPGPRDAVLVLSHDAKLDVSALTAAFATRAGYIGALGSRRTTSDRDARLREAGASDADRARLFAPCGLDIGAATVEETAIAVLGEIIADRSGRSGGSLRAASGSIRRAVDPQPASVTVAPR